MPKIENDNNTLIQSLISYSAMNNNILNRFNDEFFINYFDQQTIFKINSLLLDIQLCQIHTFISKLLQFINIKQDQTIFLVMSLIKIYKKISSTKKIEQKITVKHFINYICQLISKQKDCDQLFKKKIAIQAQTPNPNQIRDIDLNAPIIFSNQNRMISKINRQINKKQKKIDINRDVHLFFCNKKIGQIIVLARLSNKITILNQSLQFVRHIIPQCFSKIQRKMAIISLHFSESQQRIGCIISNIGLVFWDYEDRFQAQKVINNITAEKIVYLQFLNEWITLQKNIIKFWNIKSGLVKNIIQNQRAKMVNHIQQIQHLRCIAVSYTTFQQSKQIHVYQNNGFIRRSILKLNSIGASVFHYNKITQSILLTGRNQLPVYSIDPLTYNLHLVKILQGHISVINACSDIEQSLIITGDDSGIMRIWDLQKLKCEQIVNVSRCINQIKRLNNKLMYSDVRMNSVCLQKHKININEQYGCFCFFTSEGTQSYAYIFTKINCRMYDLSKGREIQILQICGPQEEIICAQYVNDQFIVTTSKNILLCLTKDFITKWRVVHDNFHQKQIFSVKGDQKNKLFTTVGKQGNILIWSANTVLYEGPRKSLKKKITTNDSKILFFNICEKYNMMVTCEYPSNIKLWDYANCKLKHVIELGSTVTALQMSNEIPVIVVGTTNEMVYLFKYLKQEGLIVVNLIQSLNLQHVSISLKAIFKLTQTNVNNINRQFKVCSANYIKLLIKNEVAILFIAYGKGNIVAININEAYIDYFKLKTLVKFAENQFRPIKQYIDRQVSVIGQNKITHLTNLQAYIQNLIVEWNKKFHKQTITYLTLYQKKYITTLGIDGFCKFVQIQTGQVVSSLCINFPLPILWNIQYIQYEAISNQIIQALQIVQKIINELQENQNNQLLNKLLNIAPFMASLHKISVKYQSLNHSKLKLLKQELTPYDLLNKNKKHSIQSIKMMEAFKRTQTIKKQKINTFQKHRIYSKINRCTKPQDVNSIIKVLSPSFSKQLSQNSMNLNKKQFPKLTNFQFKKINLLQDIEYRCQKQQNKKQTKRTKSVCNSTGIIPQIKSNFPNKQNLKDIFHNYQPLKNIKQVLKNINKCSFTKYKFKFKQRTNIL